MHLVNAGELDYNSSHKYDLLWAEAFQRRAEGLPDIPKAAEHRRTPKRKCAN